MLSRLKELAAQKKDFAFETTLAGKFYAQWLKKRQVEAYHFHLVFLYLPTAELAVERVKSRVRLGGHSIPEAVIQRRYIKGLQNFFRIYQLIADSWRFYESSQMPRLVASGAKAGKINVVEVQLWKNLQKSAE